MKTTSLYATLVALTLALPLSGLAGTATALVPELNPASASGAIGLVMGAVLLLRDRLRRR
jgi:membrane associated rhomboid family serine protease